MAGRFDGRVVLVTGAGSGIGRAATLRLAAEGAAVAALDRDAEGALRTAREASASGRRCVPITGDVSQESDVERALMLVSRNIGKLSGLVACAGIFVPADGQPAARVELDAFMAVLNVNLVGTFLAIRHSLPFLTETGGAIVTVASVAAIRGNGVGAGYTASKGGIDALTRLVATQYGPRGVRANCICPGAVDTPMTAGVHTTPDAIERAKKRIPLQKVAQPDQVASVAAFLLSDDASHMTGQTLVVDGGSTITG